ncbi:probable cytochrome P450 308a1 [Teleopsis dalmanni]|uniref:probable cytochrome P450 308a1 n=1 Tax=Teleopsis dalmanni TaxID=139649 RepID=UPI0018CCC0D2|nr:probable cytochrome P450 308a1 [Teleopsis dalmanni]
MFLEFILTILVVLLFYSGVWKVSYWRRNGIISPRGYPICGNMWKFVLTKKHFGAIYEDIYNAYADLPYVGIYRIFNEPSILVHDQDVIKDIMIRRFTHFQDNVLWVDEERDPLACCNPFIAKGEKWKQYRSDIVPIFTQSKVKLSFAKIQKACSEMDKYVEIHLDENCFEAKELFSKYLLNVVASTAFGFNADLFSNTKSEFTKLVSHIFLPKMFSLIETISLLFSPAINKLTKYHYIPKPTQQWLYSILTENVYQRLNPNDISPPTSGGIYSDYIQWLIDTKTKHNEPIDITTIIGHCSTFLLEGFETSSSLMAFAIYEFAKNAPVQYRVLQEIDEVLERYNGVLSYEALQEMSYLEASLYETLRLYPVMAALLKHCTKPFTLQPQKQGGKAFTVPKGMVMVIPVKAIHYDENLYPEPLKFQPDRFIDANEKQRLGCMYLGFGEGPRMCPGTRLALAQSKAGLVTLLSKYFVYLAGKTKNPLKISTTTFLTAADDGIWISFKPRK